MHQKDLPKLIDLATIRENYLPVGRSTLFRMISTGDFPRADLQRGRKLRLWKKETIDQWLAEQEAPRRRGVK